MHMYVCVIVEQLLYAYCLNLLSPVFISLICSHVIFVVTYQERNDLGKDGVTVWQA